jgi:hypothetical protein
MIALSQLTPPKRDSRVEVSPFRINFDEATLMPFSIKSDK